VFFCAPFFTFLGAVVSERIIETDVLVVGGGGAGFRAAIGARETGVRAMLVSKGPLARCGATPMAGADFTLDGLSLSRMGFPGEPKDTKGKFFNDIVTQGFYLNNQKLLEQYIGSAPARLKELLEWGMKVDSSEERAIFTSGLGLVDTVCRRAKTCGVDFLEDVMVLDLVIRGGRVVGALGLDIPTGELIRFRSGAVIIATGGWHKAFWPNTGMRDLSGEGIAMAHRAGAEIGNMEFITFCCNILLWPPLWRGSLATYILSLRINAELANSAGEVFLKKYDPFVVKWGTYMEWNKGFVSFASTREIRDGKGSPHGGVYFGLGSTPYETFEKIALGRFPGWKYKALDLSEMPKIFKEGKAVEVGPVVEYFDGGIVVNEKFETAVEGLYAAGECTLGPFGANRVCSAITEMLVHGAEAGKNAGAYAEKTPMPELPVPVLGDLQRKAEKALGRKDGLKPAQIRRQVQEMAHKNLSPIRTRKELSAFLSFLEKTIQDEVPQLATTSKSRIYNKEWVDAIELENMLHLLRCATIGALHRAESRGVHFREDFPYTDNENWLKENIIRYENGALEVYRRPVTITSMTPSKGSVPYLDMLKKMMESRSDVGGHH
jgi:succinate dehydrogenase/fumarate reductase flavoprotein subunit